MNNKPLVSVIIIFWNAEEFIQEAIESVFDQTYDQLELLLVDDGSTDASTEIALRYAEQHPLKVRYLEHAGHQNRGMSASRNLGIRHAKGEYIAFLDADDVYLPQKLKEQVPLLQSHPEAAMLFGRTQMWFSWTGQPEDIERDYLTEFDFLPNTLVEPPTLLTQFVQNERYLPCTGSVLLRRDIIERVGGFEEEFRDAYEDMVFYAKVYLKEPVFVAGECWDRYRQHPNNSFAISFKTGQFHPSKPNPARKTYLNWLSEYLSKQGVNDTEVWQVLQKELWPYHHPTFYSLLACTQLLMKRTKRFLKRIARWTIPITVRRWLRAQQKRFKHRPPVGWVRFGTLRRLQPISRVFGFDRGLPVDRYYIAQFLSTCTPDIQGHVLEIEDDIYTRQFGSDRVTKSDVLHVVEGNPKATIVADLTCADQIPSDTFDCIILTQVLLCIYDVRSAIKTLYRILKPSGVVLVTLPGISQISRHDMDRWGEYWRFTNLSARRLFEESFPAANVIVEVRGNVLAATAFLQGLAAQELRQQELDYRDPDYEVIIGVRAVKPEVKR